MTDAGDVQVHVGHFPDDVEDEKLKKHIDELAKGHLDGGSDDWKLEHQRLHEKHKGHETMHMEMLLILIVSLILAQVILVQWKKRYLRSYMIATMLGMWIIPLYFVISLHWMRFLTMWIFFTLGNLFIIFKATRQPLPGSTPRLVYKWYYFMHKICYGVGLLGYFTIMFTLLGINLLLRIEPQTALDFGIVALFYGLYYGVLGRDIAEISTDFMAAKIGYYSLSGLPARELMPNVCSVCGNNTIVDVGEKGIIENTCQLACGHVFHEFCLRGWCIVGKKQTCPYCREKVDLKRMFPGPWEKPQLMYGQLLDMIRYMVAWQPLIILLVQGVNYLLGLE